MLCGGISIRQTFTTNYLQWVSAVSTLVIMIVNDVNRSETGMTCRVMSGHAGSNDDIIPNCRVLSVKCEQCGWTEGE